jgi:hypothetical protein
MIAVEVASRDVLKCKEERERGSWHIQGGWRVFSGEC